MGLNGSVLGLDTPQATELIYLLNRAGADLNPKILDVEACIKELLARIGEFHD